MVSTNRAEHFSKASFTQSAVNWFPRGFTQVKATI